MEQWLPAYGAGSVSGMGLQSDKRKLLNVIEMFILTVMVSQVYT